MTSPLRPLNWLALYARFVQGYLQFRRLNRAVGRSLPVRWADRHPCLTDRTGTTGFDRHYIYHTAWAARTIARLRPALHVDISSSLYFVTSLSAFVPVRFYDFRPAPLHLSNLSSEFADLLSLPFPDQSVESISCMHVVEHVGLGRYGDPVDPEGDLKAMSELQRVVRPGGTLLFVVPVGQARVCYNAHRIYSLEQIQSSFPDLRLEQFALIPDRPEQGNLVLDAPAPMVARQKYGCGCFLWRRPA